MTEMAEKFSDLYKNTGMKPEAFTEAFQKMTPLNYKEKFFLVILWALVNRSTKNLPN